MKQKREDNDRLPVEDKELFQTMKEQSVSDNEKQFFERLEQKELSEFPVSTFDVLLSECDNEDGIFLVKCYYNEYLIGKRKNGVAIKLENMPSSLSEALKEDLFALTGIHISLLDWLRNRDYRGLNYNYEWED